MSADTGFYPDQYAAVAAMFREHLNDDQFYAIASNNHNIILAALDRAASPSIERIETEANANGNVTSRDVARALLAGEGNSVAAGAAPLPSAIRIRALEVAKDEAYLERNCLVAFLASLYPSGITRTDIPDWLPEWHGAVYVDLPTGQASWHYHDSQAHLFAHLPPYTKPWDGHTTDEKYERLAALAGESPRPVRDAPLREALVTWIEAKREYENMRGSLVSLERAESALISCVALDGTDGH